jgi:hypothetical protein
MSGHHVLRQRLVDVRPDQALEGAGDLMVLVLATDRALDRQVSLAHDVSEQVGIGAESDAQEIVEALRGRAVGI